MINEYIFVLAVSIDTFMVAISCGADCIKFPIKSSICVGMVGALMVAISIYCSEIICNFVPNRVCSSVCCGVLCAMGGMNIIKWLIQKHKNYRASTKEVLQNDIENKSVLDVFVCGSCADCDNSKEISVKEALLVSFLMSLDSITGGIASGSSLNLVEVSVSVLIVQSISVWIGSIIGRKFSNVPDISFIGGILLIVLGVLKVI